MGWWNTHLTTPKFSTGKFQTTNQFEMSVFWLELSQLVLRSGATWVGTVVPVPNPQDLSRSVRPVKGADVECFGRFLLPMFLNVFDVFLFIFYSYFLNVSMFRYLFSLFNVNNVAVVEHCEVCWNNDRHEGFSILCVSFGYFWRFHHHGFVSTLAAPKYALLSEAKVSGG